MLQVSIEHQDSTTKLILTGPLDEKAGPILSGLLPQIKRSVDIDFAHVEYFNSLGIRSWVNFLRILLDGRAVSYSNCPMEFVQQICMMPVLAKGVEVKSFSADFSCQNCGQEIKQDFACEIGKQALMDQMEAQLCKDCGQHAALQEDVDALLAFMHD